MKKIVFTSLFISNLLANESLDNLSLDELMNIKVYSATKDYRSIEEIPANITIITRKDIEKYNYKTLDELIKNVPGLFVVDNTESFQIGSRGSLGSTFQLMLNNNSIFTQRVPYESTSNRNFFAIPIESIDRIEIVKGPQAVTYGTNSMYGSINVITNDFNEKNQVSISKGNNKQEKVFARVNHFHENGGFTLNSSFYNNDGLSGDFKDSFTADYYNSRNENSAKKIDGLTKNQYKTFDFSNRYKNFTTDIYYSLTNFGIYVEPSYRNGSTVEQKEQAISLVYEDEIKEDLDYKINYINSKKNYFIDDLAIDSDLILKNDISYNKDLIDLHLNYKLNDKLKILTGTSYEKVSTKLLGVGFDSSYDVSNKDLYTKLHFIPKEDYEFSLGVRKTLRNNFEIPTKIKSDYHLLEPDIVFTDELEKKENYLPEFSAIYHINSANHLKFLYGKANQLSYQTTKDFEQIETKEINYLHIGKKYQIDTSLFNNQAKNMSLFTQNGAAIITPSKGEIETNGIEFALSYNPIYNLQTKASFTYQKSTNLVDKTINPSFSPNFLSKLSTSYTFFDTTYSVWADYISSMESNRNQQTGEPYGLNSKYNLTLNTDITQKIDKQTSVNLHITNLLDKNNKVPAGSFLQNFYNGFYTQGRIFSLGFDYKF